MAPAGAGQALRQRRSGGPLLPETNADDIRIRSSRSTRRRRRRYPRACLLVAAVLLVVIGAVAVIVRPWRRPPLTDGSAGDVVARREPRDHHRGGGLGGDSRDEARKKRLRGLEREMPDHSNDGARGEPKQKQRQKSRARKDKVKEKVARHMFDAHYKIHERDAVVTQQRAEGKEHETITCPGGSEGVLNDNYCDCSDGSDEPGTSACSHILVEKRVFECADGSGKIFASRVQDGIVDCPDGSDEATYQHT